MPNDAIVFTTTRNEEHKETTIMAVFNDSLQAQTTLLLFEEVIRGITNRYIEEHGDEILNKLSPEAIQREVEKKVAARVLKAVEHE